MPTEIGPKIENMPTEIGAINENLPTEIFKKEGIYALSAISL